MHTLKNKKVSMLLLIAVFSLFVFMTATAADPIDDPAPTRDHPADVDVPAHDYWKNRDGDGERDSAVDQLVFDDGDIDPFEQDRDYPPTDGPRDHGLRDRESDHPIRPPVPAGA